MADNSEQRKKMKAAGGAASTPKTEVKRTKVDKPALGSLPPPMTSLLSSSSSSSQPHHASGGPLLLPPPPVPPPAPDSLTIRTMNQKLDAMWNEQKRDMQAIKSDTKAQFKHISDLPLARIKRVMKSDEEVRMISAEAPILFAKACEMFVLDLTTRCYAYSEHNKRGGLERDDVFQVLKETGVYDFLAEVLINQPVPKQ